MRFLLWILCLESGAVVVFYFFNFSFSDDDIYNSPMI